MSSDTLLDEAATMLDRFCAGYDSPDYLSEFGGYGTRRAVDEAREAIERYPRESIDYVVDVLCGEQEDEYPCDGETTEAGRRFIIAAMGYVRALARTEEYRCSSAVRTSATADASRRGK